MAAIISINPLQSTPITTMQRSITVVNIAHICDMAAIVIMPHSSGVVLTNNSVRPTRHAVGEVSTLDVKVGHTVTSVPCGGGVECNQSVRWTVESGAGSEWTGQVGVSQTRRANAVRLLIGVVVGIAVAELVVEFAGGGVWSLALATFFAMLIARALNAVLTASARIVRHSLTWRMRAAPVALEQERANQLDLLASSGVMLARTAVATSHQERPSLAPAIRHLATALAEISRNPGGRATRQHGADRALDLASWLIRMGPPYRRSTRWLPLAPPFG
jgi:hypothetical protein